MSKNVYTAGLAAGLVGLIAGGLFGTYGAWSILLDLPRTSAGRWLLGLTLGIVFAVVYDYFNLQKSLPGDGRVRGVIYGLLIWVATLIIGLIVPKVGDLTFAAPVGTTLVLTAFLNIIWGFVFGTIYESK